MADARNRGSSARRRQEPRRQGARRRNADGEPESDRRRAGVDEVGPPGDPETVARIVCLRLLDRRARSRSELAAALAARGVPDDAASRVLDRFVQVGLIDDAALAGAMADSARRDRGLARRAVAVKLRQRGIDDEVAAGVLTAIDPDDERQRARELVDKRLRALSGLPPEVQLRRLVGLLGRKGYPPGMAFEIARAAIGRSEDEPNDEFAGAELADPD